MGKASYVKDHVIFSSSVAKTGAVVAREFIEVKPGATYKLSFSATGDCTLRVMVNIAGNNKKAEVQNFNFLSPKLTGDLENYDKIWICPRNVSKVNFTFYKTAPGKFNLSRLSFCRIEPEKEQN